MDDLFTIEQIRERFPPDGAGRRPSKRLLRERAVELGCCYRVGRRTYLTEQHWEQLIASFAAPGLETPLRRKPYFRGGRLTLYQQECERKNRDKELERWGLSMPKR
jgi:hypothetical protein